MKKLVSIFLSLVMALSVCSVAFVSNAQTIAQPLKYDYTLEKNCHAKSLRTCLSL